MGYGEFGGGGSVKWLVTHGDDKISRHDKDTKPKDGTKGNFKVVIRAASKKSDAQAMTTFGTDGSVTLEFPITKDDQQITIRWPDE